MSLSFTSFTYNAAYSGGVLSLDTSAYLYAKTCKFTSNLALDSAGVLAVYTDSYFTLKGCDFTSNSANTTSAINVVGSSTTYNNTIYACNFESNTAIMNTLSLMYSKTNITKCYFSKNTADERTKNIFIGFSNVTITDTSFKETSYSNAATLAASDGTQGSFLFLIMDVVLYLDQVNFYNGISSQGGAVYLSGQSSVYFYRSAFDNNYSGSKGGAIYASGYSHLEFSSCTFTRNHASAEGDDIYSANSEKTLNITGTTISNIYATTAIYVQTATLYILDSTLKGMTQGGSSYGAALRCIDCRGITITSSTFQNGKATYGGLVSIEESDANKQTTDKVGKYTISSSTFEAGEANVGGCIYLDNP